VAVPRSFPSAREISKRSSVLGEVTVFFGLDGNGGIFFPLRPSRSEHPFSSGSWRVSLSLERRPFPVPPLFLDLFLTRRRKSARVFSSLGFFSVEERAKTTVFFRAAPFFSK